MLQLTSAIAGALALVFAAGCATVAVYDAPASTEFSLEGPGAELRRAAKRYCETARNRGLAEGEASLQGLAGSIFGSEPGTAPYWKRIGADAPNGSGVQKRIRTDAGELARGLSELNMQARLVLREGVPAREDLIEFERALVHAGQARDSLVEAWAMGSGAARGAAQAHGIRELNALEDTLRQAGELADRFASARAEEPLS